MNHPASQPRKSLRCLFALILLSGLPAATANANDSSYYLSGNQIIPLQETDISVKKEVLTLKRIKDNKVRVTVDYTFHNPAEEKSLLMGFEANSPSGDARFRPVNGAHPYIENFTVSFNGKAIPHKVSFLPTDVKKGGKTYPIEELEKQRPEPEIIDSNAWKFFYVYHFPATFPTGDTKVIHTYDYRMSGSVVTAAELDYLLTPAARWANNQIDDFTLIIDLGEFQEYHVQASFFENLESWSAQGRTRIRMEEVIRGLKTVRAMTVWQQHGSVTFHAKNFRPKGEISLFVNSRASRCYALNFENFLSGKESASVQLPYHLLPWLPRDQKLKDEFTLRVLKNYPYARRGYLFKNKQLRAFFKTQPWYMLDPDYKGGDLSPEEIEWLKELGQMTVAE